MSTSLVSFSENIGDTVQGALTVNLLLLIYDHTGLWLALVADWRGLHRVEFLRQQHLSPLPRLLLIAHLVLLLQEVQHPAFISYKNNKRLINVSEMYLLLN